MFWDFKIVYNFSCILLRFLVLKNVETFGRFFEDYRSCRKLFKAFRMFRKFTRFFSILKTSNFPISTFTLPLSPIRKIVLKNPKMFMSNERNGCRSK